MVLRGAARAALRTLRKDGAIADWRHFSVVTVAGPVTGQPRTSGDGRRAALWDTLEAVPGSFVDAELKSRHTDLLFRVSLSGREARLYLLYEHQSTPHPLMPFRLVAYAVEEASASDEEASAQPRAEEPGAGSKPWSTGDKPAGRAPSKVGFSPGEEERATTEANMGARLAGLSPNNLGLFPCLGL